MKYLILPVLLFIFSGASDKKLHFSNDDVIMPYKENNHYWQFKGVPVLLIGGTINDNLFQISHLESHLDSLKLAGGNYVRNSMSDRDPGDERAFVMVEDGKYDLDLWNERYWQKFKNLLQLAYERDIIVQIEVWDRFDHSRSSWLNDPYNPKNNINYTYQMAGLDSVYPLHPGKNTQPFFFTVPELNNNEVLLKYQNAFVDKLLSMSLKYPNVLYCIDNETNGVEEWAVYWAAYLKEKAGNRRIMVTQMWDDWDIKSDMHKRTLGHPERYDYIDMSQNSQNPGHLNWENGQYVLNYIKSHPRPVNSTKIYGSNKPGSWLEQGKDEKHAVSTFFRNLLGGFASSRFHRPDHGLGLSPASIGCMKSVRNIESVVKFWEIGPVMELLSDNEEGEAYISADNGEHFVIFFPGKGDITLDMNKSNGIFTLSWIDVTTGEWISNEEITAGTSVKIKTVSDNGAVAVIKMK